MIADNERRSWPPTRRRSADVLDLRIDDLTPPEARPAIDELWAAFLRDGTQRGAFAIALGVRAGEIRFDLGDGRR